MYVYFVTCSLSKDTCRVIKSLSSLFHNTAECADEKYIRRNDKNRIGIVSQYFYVLQLQTNKKNYEY